MHSSVILYFFYPCNCAPLNIYPSLFPPYFTVQLLSPHARGRQVACSSARRPGICFQRRLGQRLWHYSLTTIPWTTEAGFGDWTEKGIICLLYFSRMQNNWSIDFLTLIISWWIWSIVLLSFTDTKVEREVQTDTWAIEFWAGPRLK